MLPRIAIIVPVTVLFMASACERQAGERADDEVTVRMEQTGWLAADELIEASGMQASHSRKGDYFVHNDQGQPLVWATDEAGADLGVLTIVPAKNRDWEDLTSVPVDAGRWLVVGDIGDNWSRRDSIKLYFVDEPKPGRNDRYSGHVDLRHWLTLTYPDGPRDAESLAYDAAGGRILLLSKRDKPPRLYAVDLQTALSTNEAQLEFLGEIAPLRPPTIRDRARWGVRTEWISQPTGMDISPDGREAVIITYRSLYRYRRKADEDWLTAMRRTPDEVLGPRTVQNEAVAYSTDGQAIYVTTEKRPTPIYRFRFVDRAGPGEG